MWKLIFKVIDTTDEKEWENLYRKEQYKYISFHVGVLFSYRLPVIWMKALRTFVAGITAGEGCVCKISLGQR